MPCREALFMPNCGCRNGTFRVRADFKIGPTDLRACPKCVTANIRGGYMQVVEYWGFLTTCDEQCLTDVTIYYNINNVGSVTVLDYITDCLTTPTVNTVGTADPIVIGSCATASIDTSCFMGAVPILEEVQLIGSCPDGSDPILNVFLIFNQLEGTDHNGVFTLITHYFLQRIIQDPIAVEICPPNWIMSTRKCTTCYRQIRQVDAFNVKEDYEILRGLTLGSTAYEQDFDIHILRLLKLIT